jgi:hypothetical protein
MAFTIVRIAAKPATFHSLTAVNTESKALFLRIEADTRLAAAAGGAARYFADAAGLSTQATAQLQTSVVAACQAEFQKLAQGETCVEITLTRHADRLEIALSHAGGNPAADTPAVSAGVDTVKHEARNGQSITRLTKFLG